MLTPDEIENLKRLMLSDLSENRELALEIIENNSSAIPPCSKEIATLYMIGREHYKIPVNRLRKLFDYLSEQEKSLARKTYGIFISTTVKPKEFLVEQANDFLNHFQVYESVFLQNPEMAKPFSAIAGVLSDKHYEYELAIKIYELHIKYYPKAPRSHFRIAYTIYAQMMDYRQLDKILYHFEKTHELDPYSNAASNLASIYIHFKFDKEIAKAWANKTLEYYPGNLSAHGTLASIFCLYDRDIEKGLALFEKHYAEAKGHFLFCNKYAYTLGELRIQPDKAIEIARRGTELSTSEAAQDTLAYVLWRCAKDYEAAEEIYQKMNIKKSNDYEALANYAAMIMEWKQDYKTAKKLLKRSLKIKDFDIFTLVAMGNYYRDGEKDRQAARKWYEKALAVYPDFDLAQKAILQL